MSAQNATDPWDETVGPLHGIVIIDLTRVLSGPFATMLLGDLGATVIKVENVKSGDTTRSAAPFRNGQSHYFLSINRNKKSLSVDLATEEGRQILRDLCAKADVLIENFRPGTLQNLGLDPEILRQKNPDLIVCSISGFGQTGPLRDRIAYDVITQAMSGVISTNGEPTGAPVRLGLPVGDLTGGLLAVIGILSSLLGRHARRGKRDIDVSLHDGLISLLSYLGGLYDISGEAPARVGARHPTIVPYGTFETKDGWLALAIFTTRFWQKFCLALGLDALNDDVRFKTTADRMRNRVVLESIVDEIIRGRTTAEWEQLFINADVPASAILSVPDALEHEHTSARDMFPLIAHPVYGEVRVPGPPLKLGGKSSETPQPPPLLGEHTAEVLQTYLGLTDEAIENLAAARVIRRSCDTQTSKTK